MYKWTLGQLGQNKPKQSQIQKGQNERNVLHNKGLCKYIALLGPEKTKPNFETAKTNANLFTKRDYEK